MKLCDVASVTGGRRVISGASAQSTAQRPSHLSLSSDDFSVDREPNAKTEFLQGIVKLAIPYLTLNLTPVGLRVRIRNE